MANCSCIDPDPTGCGWCLADAERSTRQAYEADSIRTRGLLHAAGALPADARTSDAVAAVIAERDRWRAMLEDAVSAANDARDARAPSDLDRARHDLAEVLSKAREALIASVRKEPK